MSRHLVGVALGCAALSLIACSDNPTEPPAERLSVRRSAEQLDPATIRLVRELAVQRGIGPLPRSRRVREPLVRLGRALAFDPILSGHRNISCGTCHLPSFGTGDGKSLSVGEGGTGFGPGRIHAGGIFIPRNAPPLFNLGAMRRLFWDGRIEVDDAGRVRTPAGDAITPEMERVFEFGAISALPMFPVTNRQEMRGMTGNELAVIPDAEFGAIWAALMKRLGAIPEYRAMFRAAYPETPFEKMTFAHASNAMAGFFVDQLTVADTPWDRFLAGEDRALTRRQLTGAQTFLTLKCSICHSGATFSDQEFHNVAVAQFGPGHGNGPSLRDDFGRENVTAHFGDRYRFRTTPLRNVELTGPFGHTGAIASLREFIAHYSESDLKLRAFDPGTLEPVLQGTMVPNTEEIIALRDTIIVGVVLTEELIDQLTDYMSALTSPSARYLSRIVPPRVPSRLPVDRP